MVTQTILSKKTVKQLAHFTKKIRKSGIPVERLIVFGSQAKGTAKPWSDIDVCVVSPIFGKDRPAERLTLLRLIDARSVDIEPHPYNVRDLSEKWDILAHDIKSHGIVVS